MGQYYVVEKKNPLAVHCIADTRERAEYWVKEKAPLYCSRGYFMDKTITPESFEIRERVKQCT